MAEVSKADWKLFTERVPAWQERYMEKLLKEYAGILAGKEQASARFWALKERIDLDRKSVGVGLCLRKQTFVAELCMNWVESRLRQYRLTIN